jgi:hypothetical protein
MRRLAQTALWTLLCGCVPEVELTSGDVRGTVLTSWQPDQYRSPETQATVRELARVGINHLAVMTTWYQSGVAESDIAPDPQRTPADHAVRYALGEGRDRGMVTVLKPHLDLPDNTWRGEIHPSDNADWFRAYTAFIVHYAQIAEEERADWLVIGTELKGTEWDERWRDVIAEVRAVFHGQITYAANWDSYADVAWWDALDVVGIDAYFPLTSRFDPTPDELRGAWEDIHRNLDAFAASVDQDIVLTEVGYQSRDGANTSPWWAPTERTDTEEQLACLDALLGTLSAGERVRGAFLWKTFFDPSRDEDDFDVLYKPAEQIVAGAWAR